MTYCDDMKYGERKTMLDRAAGHSVCDVTVNAEVVSLQGMSAHADARLIVEWLRTAPRPPRGLYLTHGEPGLADALRRRIENTN